MTTTYITVENKRIDVPDGTTLAEFWAANTPAGTPLPMILLTHGPEVPEYARGTLPKEDFSRYQEAVKAYPATTAKTGGGLGWLMLGALALGIVWFTRKKG